MKNGGGSKADEAMQGEKTGNQEDENVLKQLSEDENVLPVTMMMFFAVSISSDSTQLRGGLGKVVEKEERWIEWHWLIMMVMMKMMITITIMIMMIMMMIIMVIVMIIMIMMLMRLRIVMMRRGFGQKETERQATFYSEKFEQPNIFFSLGILRR